MYEHVSEPLAPPAALVRRLVTSTSVGIAVIAVSLLVGMAGFRLTENLPWIDAFLNSAMLLGGEGPLDHNRGLVGKLFEGVYAIYCGLAVISVAGIIFAPVLHRFFHHLQRSHQLARNPDGR